MQDFRIALDSPEWGSSEKMSTALKLLKRLLNVANPTQEMIDDFISKFDWANYVEREYYFTLPYFVDFLLEHFEEVRTSLTYFSHTLMTPDGIPEECKKQIRGCRHRIAELMLRALESNSSRDNFDYDHACYLHVATIAAAYMEPYVGNLVERIPDEL